MCLKDIIFLWISMYEREKKKVIDAPFSFFPMERQYYVPSKY